MSLQTQEADRFHTMEFAHQKNYIRRQRHGQKKYIRGNRSSTAGTGNESGKAPKYGPGVSIRTFN